MGTQEYKYDVALSFVAQDEQLAIEINDLLQDRLRIFLYSKKQEEIAGTDGEMEFNAVFSEESRLVVVLYRSEWGKTPWTRIEETAIRNRAFEHGYDFVVFIPLEEPATVPKWLPRSQLWIGLKRWGVSGAASVIESRVEGLGGEPHEESAVERAARLGRQLEHEGKKKTFRNSVEGVNAANEEFEIVFKELTKAIEEINTTIPTIHIDIKRSQNHIVLMGIKHVLSIVWRCRYSNVLDESCLYVRLLDGHPHYPGLIVFDEPRQLNSIKLNIVLSALGTPCWIVDNPLGRSFSSTDLASYILKYYMDQTVDK